MKDYTLFEIADFAMDEDFIRWVIQPDKENNLFWENWLKRNPSKHLMVAEARKIVESIGFRQPALPNDYIEAEIERLLHAIEQPVETTIPTVTKRRLPVAFKYAAAALILLGMFALSTLFFHHSQNSPAKFAYADITANTKRKLVENVNTSKKSSVVQLPDGSTVQLASDSRISYENHFDTLPNRDVYLSGEASFNVKKDPHHPFRVFANELVAKALGTSFTVRSFESDTVIQVIVNSGKVNVYTQEPANNTDVAVSGRVNGIIVTPNQRLLYEKGSQEFQKELLENPTMVNQSSANKSMVYEDAAVEKVFNDLTGDFGINIVYDNEVLRRCTLTANLSTESFYQRLDLICRAIGAKYTVIDAQVVIEAAGCQ